MTNALNINIVPEDSGYGVGAILFRFLPWEYISGIQNTILRVMEMHPEMAVNMPIFEDKRYLKLPTFAGLDIFQSHIKNCSAYIKSHTDQLNPARLACLTGPGFMPPLTLLSPVQSNASQPNVSSVMKRRWLVHRILDYDCSQRTLSLRLIPSVLKDLSSDLFTDANIETLVMSPLLLPSLSPYVQLKTYQERGEAAVSGISPLTVLQHPLSRSHIARSSIQRLEKDIRDYADDEMHSVLPMLKLHLTPTSTSSDTNTALSAVTEAIEMIRNIITTLVNKRDEDSKLLKLGVIEVVKYCNAETTVSVNEFMTIKHYLLRYSKAEVDLVRRICIYCSSICVYVLQ